MKLLNKALRKQLPPLYSTAGEDDPMVICKFVLLRTWTWYPIEFDGHDLFWGFVNGLYPGLGYFTLSDLEAFCGHGGAQVERDRYFKPCRLSELQAKLHR